jgi:hypothetical protein
MKDVPVTKDAGYYWVFNKNFRLEESERANGAPANMATWDASTASYNVREHALKDVITETDIDNADSVFDLRADTVEFLSDKIMMRQEKMVSDLLFTTTSFSNNAPLNTASSWNYNTTTSAPIQNVLSATAVILAQSGKRPNVMATNFAVFAALKENQNVYNRLAYTKDKLITEQILASVFDVSNFYVGAAVYETNKEGESATYSSIIPSDVLVGYFEGTPGMKKVTTANMFRVKKKGSPYRVKNWRDENIEGEYIECQTKAVPKVVASLCAYLFKTAALI